MGDLYRIYVNCNYSKHKPVAVNREIILHENIHVLNIRANKILLVSDKYILIWNYYQLYVIKITAYVLPIMTGYLAIATALLVLLQIYLSPIRLHTDTFEIQSSITRPLQWQCYPGIAVGDKDLHKSHSQLIKPCASLSSTACQWPQMNNSRINMNPVSFCQTITTELGLHSFTWRQLPSHNFCLKYS